MGHLTSRDAYKSLEERLNLFTQGAVPSKTLTEILRVLFSEEDARRAALLPIRPFTLKKAAAVWETTEAQAEKILDHLCEKGLLVDSLYEGTRRFVLPPPMIGFFEFALMRTRGDFDQKYLSELFYQYINVEEDFIKNLLFSTETKLGRAFVQEPVLLTDKANHILDYERASHIIEDAAAIGVGLCFCRHKNMHLGIPCELGAPLETCLTFDNIARSLAAHSGSARLISKAEAMDILSMSRDIGLVQIGENVRKRPAFMCNCCGCCCEALQAARRFSPMQPIATTNYLPRVKSETCISCGKCARVCPILALSVSEGRPVVDESICLGCGVCARKCPTKSIEMNRRPVQVITPVNSTHRFVLQAIEKGTLQNLIFDNQAFANHRALAAALGAVLRLPPVKRAMASKQFKSVYLDRLLSRME